MPGPTVIGSGNTKRIWNQCVVGRPGAVDNQRGAAPCVVDPLNNTSNQEAIPCNTPGQRARPGIRTWAWSASEIARERRFRVYKKYQAFALAPERCAAACMWRHQAFTLAPVVSVSSGWVKEMRD